MPTASELRDAFAKFDANGDGYLSVEELVGVFTRPVNDGKPMTEEQARAYVAKHDKNGDGRLDLDEFAASVVAEQRAELFTSWQPWVDALLGLVGVTAAGIYDLQGNPWAYSAGFDAQVAEVAAVCAHFAEPSGLTATGAMVNGVKYMYLRGEENDNVYVRKGATGVYFYKCATCVLVAFHDEGIPHGKCEDAVRKTADALRENNW